MKDENYVYVTLTGEATVEDFENARAETQVLLSANDCMKVLVGAKREAPEEPFVDDFDFTSQLGSFFPRRTRIALVVPDDQMEYMQFVKNVAQNRGVNMVLFSDKEQALVWLLAD
jgi:hypothetical protein